MDESKQPAKTTTTPTRDPATTTSGQPENTETSSSITTTTLVDDPNIGGMFRGVAAALRSTMPAVRTIGGFRPLAFLSEGAVAGKSILPASLYYGAWGISGVAIAADITTQVVDAPEEKKVNTGLYYTAFHIPASLVVPAVIIHQVVHLAEKVVKNTSLPPRVKPLVPVAAALLSIVPVVPAVDTAAEMLMEPTLGAYLGLEFSHHHKESTHAKEDKKEL